MQRREFISLVGGAATVWPAGRAHAQQSGQMRRIGVLLGNAEGDTQAVTGLAAFKTALQELGWIGGRYIQIDYRFAAADLDRMQTFAKELVVLQPDLIMGQTTPVIAALQRETKTIPRFRSRWKRICRECAAPRRQHHGIHQHRGIAER
jgi:putative tryptophan/tyrosine transport system substrate-binding protein